MCIYAYILNFFPYIVLEKKLFHSPSNTASDSGGHFFSGPTCHLCRLLRLLTGIFLHPPPLLLSASTHLTAPHQSSHLQPLLISFFASFSVLATASLISDRQFLHLVDGVPAHQDKVKDIYVFFSCHVILKSATNNSGKQ